MDVRQPAEQDTDMVVSQRPLHVAWLQHDIRKQADPGVGMPFLLQPQEKGQILMVWRQRRSR